MGETLTEQQMREALFGGAAQAPRDSATLLQASTLTPPPQGVTIKTSILPTTCHHEGHEGVRGARGGVCP